MRIYIRLFAIAGVELQRSSRSFSARIPNTPSPRITMVLPLESTQKIFPPDATGLLKNLPLRTARSFQFTFPVDASTQLTIPWSFQRKRFLPSRRGVGICGTLFSMRHASSILLPAGRKATICFSFVTKPQEPITRFPATIGDPMARSLED